MGEFYLQIKWVHIVAVIASGTLFALRGIAVQFAASWAMAAPLRHLSHTIDTVLVAAAMMLVTIVHQYPFVQAWLTVKICLLVVYVALGTFALKRGRTPRVRLVCFVSALTVFGFIVSVAVEHHPLGALLPLVS